nr:UBP-type zinc finger domain-containing protein [Lolliginicoccus suaedae]
MAPVLPTSAGCLECLRLGERDWVHLRTCLACGHVGCCDSSPGKHAAAHAEQQDHPIAASAEPGEQWAWCYLDQTEIGRAR